MHQSGLKSWAGDLCRFLEEINFLLSFPSPALSFPSLPITLSLILCYVNSSFLVFLLELTLSSKLNHLVLPGNFLCAIVRGFSQYLPLWVCFFRDHCSMTLDSNMQMHHHLVFLFKKVFACLFLVEQEILFLLCYLGHK